MRATASLYLLFALLGSPLLCAAGTSKWEAAPVVPCTSVSLASPGRGVSYRGTVRNDDYGLTLVVPPNLTGWGAADVAPFHGFTIFLPERGRLRACLVFEIHLRVALGDHATERESGGHEVQVGNIKGLRWERTGPLDGVPFKNVMVEFSVGRGEEVYDGQVWLVTPLEAVEKNEAVLSAFLSPMRFEGTDGPRAR